MAMSAPAALFEPRTQVRVLGSREHDLRQQRSETQSTEELLLRWTRLLELSLVFVSLTEAVNRLGLRTSGEVVANTERLEALVRTLTRLNPTDVLDENAEAWKPHSKLPPPDDALVTIDRDELIRTARSILIHAPFETMQKHRTSHPALVHRGRLAYDGLRAFIARHLHPQQATVSVTGHAYAEGRLSIDEVATLLQLALPDAVALLEEQGFRRSVEALRMSESARDARFAKIRAERLERNGETRLDEQLVMRDVAAGQRIEDVDARPWLRR